MYCLQHRQQKIGPQMRRLSSVRSPQLRSAFTLRIARLLSWECSTCIGVGNSSRPITMVNPESLDADMTVEAVIHARRKRRVLVRIPKSARSTVAEALASTIDDALSTDDDSSWSKLLSFASVVLCVSSRDNDSSTFLASIVRSNLLKFDSSFPTWTVFSPTIPHVSSMSPTQSLRSLVHRKLSLGDVSAAIRVIASDDTILDITPEVLRAFRLKHPGDPADVDFSPFPLDINGFSASENDVAKVFKHFAVGSSGGIDGLRPAQLRDQSSNYTAEASQHLIRSLIALVNRLLNADVSDHARKLLFSANLTDLRKDGRIRPIAVGNAFRRLASKVGCAAVTPSLARQLSPSQIGVGIQGACEAAVHAIRRYVIDHTESGQSHQNRLIVKLDLKNAFNTVRRDHLLIVCCERIPPIARLAHVAYSSPPIARLAHVAYSSPPVARLTHLAYNSPPVARLAHLAYWPTGQTGP